VRPTQQIFIVGPARSGTSIMMRAMRVAFPAHKSCDEGHFLDLSWSLAKAVDEFLGATKSYYRDFPNMTVSRIDGDTLIRRLVETLVDENTRTLGSPVMIDKTHGPLMVRSLPLLRAVLPNSRAIMMKRRLNEFLRSANVKFPWWTPEERVEHWIATMQAWLEVKPQLRRYCLEIEHLDLVECPLKVGRALAAHFGLPHARGAELAEFFRSHSIEKTPNGSYAPVALEELGFTPEAAAALIERTRELRTQLGYGANEDYYASAEE
jgi:hypothetical protein